MGIRTLVFLGTLTLGALSAGAQSTITGYQDRLVRLAEIMGSLYHLRDVCGRSEGDLWRKNLQRLMETEDPPQDTRGRMVAGFNQSYEQQRRSHSRCSGAATDEITRLAREGERLTNQLAQQ